MPVTSVFPCSHSNNLSTALPKPASLTTTSVFPYCRPSNSLCHYRSTCKIAGYFGISVLPTIILSLRLPKYMLECRLLRYFRATILSNSLCDYRSTCKNAGYFGNCICPPIILNKKYRSLLVCRLLGNSISRALFQLTNFPTKRGRLLSHPHNSSAAVPSLAVLRHKDNIQSGNIRCPTEKLKKLHFV